MMIRLFFSLFFVFTLFSSVSGVRADITTDGSLGPAVNLSGPEYEIAADLGKQAGGNLFHSFGKFGLDSGESATFTGPDSVRNVISRISGGNPSYIDGLIRSAITGADFFFLNPSGMMFGPNASLDISGSFHFSTADYLRMGESDLFYAMPTENEILSVAAPSAFGFLGENPAPVSFYGSGSQYAEDNFGMNGIKVPEGETLSVIGGDILISGGQFADAGLVETRLKAPGGEMNLISVASPGEAVFTESGWDTDSFSEMGNMEISQGSYATVTGEGAGNLFIRAGRFVMDGAEPGPYSDYPAGLFATSLGDKNGGGMNIQVTDDMVITNDAFIASNNLGAGNGETVRIDAGNLLITNDAYILRVCKEIT